VRIDAGIDSASVVPMAYDPMIAKLCTYAADRARAISRMHRALDETVVLGVTTNIPLHHRVLMHPEFLAGDYDTGLLGTPLPTAPSASDDAAVVAAAIQRYLTESHQAGADDTPSAWWRDGRRF
jgi:acetyl/propionyl-CoA carboxylase alpha subunit